MKENERIEIKLPSGDKLVAMIGQDPNHKEILVGAVNKNGHWQDLIAVEPDDNKYKVLLWCDNMDDTVSGCVEIDKFVEEDE